jgi:hypothetical protein
MSNCCSADEALKAQPFKMKLSEKLPFESKGFSQVVITDEKK